MSPNKLVAFFLVACIVAACNSGQAIVKQGRVYRVPYDTLSDDIAAFIAGQPHGISGCLPGLDTITSWEEYSLWMNSGYNDLDTGRFSKMKLWADGELIDRFSSTTLFYPFGGPDFLNVNIFYPNADNYILIGLEPVGSLPDLCSMSTQQVDKYLNDVSYSLKDIFKRSYFITGNMIDALKKSSVNGTLPVISLFIKWNGYNIVSIRSIGIDSTGRWKYSDSLETTKNITKGVKVDFAADTGRRIQSVFYFQTDISDDGLNKNTGFRKYLAGLPYCYTYLKAASYLMHGTEFSMIRNTVLEKSKTILQDDSGIAYKLFDKSLWEIELFGMYQKPGSDFFWITEPDLAVAYLDSAVKPVPFTLGYNWKTHAINMQYAVKKQR